MNANEIVEKIRNNIPTRGFEYTYPNEKYMIAEIQKLLDKGIEVNVVDKPIVKHEDKRILLHSFYVVEGIVLGLIRPGTVSFYNFKEHTRHTKIAMFLFLVARVYVQQHIF